MTCGASSKAKGFFLYLQLEQVSQSGANVLKYHGQLHLESEDRWPNSIHEEWYKNKLETLSRSNQSVSIGNKYLSRRRKWEGRRNRYLLWVHVYRNFQINRLLLSEGCKNGIIYHIGSILTLLQLKNRFFFRFPSSQIIVVHMHDEAAYTTQSMNTLTWRMTNVFATTGSKHLALWYSSISPMVWWMMWRSWPSLELGPPVVYKLIAYMLSET